MEIEVTLTPRDYQEYVCQSAMQDPKIRMFYIRLLVLVPLLIILVVGFMPSLGLIVGGILGSLLWIIFIRYFFRRFLIRESQSSIKAQINNSPTFQLQIDLDRLYLKTPDYETPFTLDNDLFGPSSLLLTCAEGTIFIPLRCIQKVQFPQLIPLLDQAIQASLKRE